MALIRIFLLNSAFWLCSALAQGYVTESQRSQWQSLQITNFSNCPNKGIQYVDYKFVISSSTPLFKVLF